MDDSDEKLIERFLAGESEAFSALIDRYQKSVLGLAHRMTGDAQMAEDLFQEIFLKAYRAVAELRDRSRFRSWLYTLALRHIRRSVRDRWRQRIELGESPEVWVDPHRGDAEVEERDQIDRLKKAVLGLPPRQREIVLLRSYEGLDYVEISKVTGVSEENARANFYQGLRRLKHWLGSEPK